MAPRRSDSTIVPVPDDIRDKWQIYNVAVGATSAGLSA
jgi:hypothetical protein